MIGKLVCGIKRTKKGKVTLYRRFERSAKKIRENEWAYPVFRAQDGTLIATLPAWNSPLDSTWGKIRNLPVAT